MTHHKVDYQSDQTIDLTGDPAAADYLAKLAARNEALAIYNSAYCAKRSNYEKIEASLQAYNQAVEEAEAAEAALPKKWLKKK